MKSGMLPTDDPETLKAESVFETEQGIFNIEVLNLQIFFRDHKIIKFAHNNRIIIKIDQGRCY